MHSRAEVPNLRCPSCGYDGRDDDPWRATCTHPFRLVERVIRTWTFVAAFRASSVELVTQGLPVIDEESGDGVRLECGACFIEFDLPNGVTANVA